MSMTGLSAFDDTVHRTNVWLKDLMERLDTNSRKDAYRALRITLHAVRDRIPTNEAVHFAAQFPMLVRGFYYEGWQPHKALKKERNVEDFISNVAKEFEFSDVDLSDEDVVRQVFAMLKSKISPGEIKDVRDCLTPAICELWDNASFSKFYK